MLDDPFFRRNLIYGLEDSLVSTTGLVIGVSLAGMQNRQVLTSGIILVLVESLSMAFGSFVSEDSFMTQSGLRPTWDVVVTYAGVMLTSYVAAGTLPLLPFALDLPNAWMWSAATSLAALFLVLYAYQDKERDEARKLRKTALLSAIAAGILTLSVLTGGALKSD
jgi:4-hydroxybenzoate polyprenyltransferase